MSFEVLKKISKFRGKRTRERLKRTATYVLNPDLKSVNGVTNRDKKSYSSSLKHPYPYIEEVRELVAPDADYLDEFCLVGENWSTNPEAPILPFFGCNDWKYGFLADYFPEYRVAFAPRKFSGFRASRAIGKFGDEIDTVAIWGCTESNYFRRYLNKKGISIWRVEDGFIRSAELGAAHSTPYSLAIDKSGIYYDPNSGSELERILSTYDFESEPELIKKAAIVRRAIIEDRLSKYNPPCFKNSGEIKVRKRVAVLGQVDSDASIKFGNPKGWSSLDLIKLAYQENPGAEIVYRPHPEVFRGFQKSSLKKKHVEMFATISTPNTSFVDFIDDIDHCYTISSLSGFECLIRGKKVTVVGAPFYSGWGLTDDRVEISHRSRTLSLDELFAGSYLIYPKYLGDLKDSFSGLTAACARIKADQEILLWSSFKKGGSENLNKYVHSYLWPSVLMRGQENKDASLAFLKEFHAGRFISEQTGEIGVRAFVFFCLGQLKDEQLVELFLKKVRDFIEPKAFNRILIGCVGWISSRIIDKNISWLIVNNDDVSFARDYLGENSGISSNIDFEEGRSDDVVHDIDSLSETLNYLVDLKDFDQAQSVAEVILLSGKNLIGTLRSLIQISSLKFDFRSSMLISRLLYGMDPYASNRFAILSEFRARKSLAEKELLQLDWLSKLLLIKPDQIVNIRFALEGLSDSDYFESVFKSLISQGRLDRELSFRKIKYYIELEQYRRAEVEVKKLILSGDRSDHARVLYSQILSQQGNLADAIALITSAISKSPNSIYVSEAFRLYIQACDYKSSLELLKFALSQGIRVGEMHRRKLYFGNRNIERAFETFRELEIRSSLNKYFPSKFWDFSKGDLESIPFEKGICAISIFGPGDEIRFASIYNDVVKSAGGRGVVAVTVSPKLETLFKRSFPDIEFICTPKPRHSDRIDLEDCSDVPGSDIVGIVNNAAVSAINNVGTSVMVTDFLASYRKDYFDFPGVPYLRANSQLVSKFRDRLSDERVIVGISWRSSIRTSGRNEHYLDVRELSPLFGVEGVQFVNLQYDECSQELAWVDDHFPGKLLNFEDLDQYNDFDGVSALMSCLDLVISPATTVVELAGALGVDTWLFSNSSELDWRKKDESGKDVWHSSVTLVDLERKGDKTALVEEIRSKLERFIKEKPSKTLESKKMVF